MVKVFPAEIGGPGYLKAIKGPLPQVRLMPTGGVNLETLPKFIQAGRVLGKFAGRERRPEGAATSPGCAIWRNSTWNCWRRFEEHDSPSTSIHRLCDSGSDLGLRAYRPEFRRSAAGADGESAGTRLRNRQASATREPWMRNFNGAVFQVPGDWEEVPTKSGVIDAEFEVPGPGGKARLTLSTATGGVAENVRRWKGQFLTSSDDPSPRESKLAIDGRDATLVELFGSYQDMLQPGQPQPDSAMLGVVIPLRETNYFVKLTGPRDTVTEAREAFLEFVESGKFKE